MPKRSYPFDFYSHNSQRKFFLPDREYLTTVYEKTLKRLFEAAASATSSTKKNVEKESEELNDKNNVEEAGNKEENKNVDSTTTATTSTTQAESSCNQCFDINNEISKIRCDFCEKYNCSIKCIQKCSDCNQNFCPNCITMSYKDKIEAEYVCYSCNNQ